MAIYDKNKVLLGTAAPTTGAWVVGDLVINTTQSDSGVIAGWKCTVAGTAGTWVAIGAKIDVTGAITAGTSITATLGNITATDGDVVITDATNGVTVGANKVLGARGAALTAQLTSLTHTAPGTPDYALQDLTDTGGFGFKTKDEGNSVLAVILNLQTRVAQLEARLKVTGGHGLIAD